jgi:cytochrome P450
MRKEVNNDDLLKLEFTSAILKETTRKWPVVPQFARQSKQDLYFEGYFIPKNSWIMVIFFYPP